MVAKRFNAAPEKPFVPPKKIESVVLLRKPTAEQTKWLKDNPNFSMMNHNAVLKFKERGTLMPDGAFVPESSGRPAMDGNGMISVGVALKPNTRKLR